MLTNIEAGLPRAKLKRRWAGLPPADLRSLKKWWVMVRPQALDLSGQGQGTEGLVRDVGFLGGKTRCLVQFNGLDKAVVTLLAGRAPQNGELAFFTC
jgi:hypothetical protein